MIADVRFWHKADIRGHSTDVRFWVNSGHQRATIQCLLLTQNGHQPTRRLTPSGTLMRAGTMLEAVFEGSRKREFFTFFGGAAVISVPVPGAYNETCGVVTSSINRFTSSCEMEAAVRIVALRGLVPKSARLWRRQVLR
jgi:hypothetical protein